MLSTALVWCAIGGLVCLGASSIFGGPVRMVVVRGDSMYPTYHSGDLLVVEKITTPVVGDVVTYPIEAGEGNAHVVHRATGGNAEDGFVTRGDNRKTDDPWTPTADEIDGRVTLHVPGAGKYFVGWLLPLFIAALASIALTWALWIAPESEPDENQESVDDITPAGAVQEAA